MGEWQYSSTQLTLHLVLVVISFTLRPLHPRGTHYVGGRVGVLEKRKIFCP
jgi:hypothetical protein